MKIFVQEGHALDFIAPAGGVTSGVPLLVGTVLVIPATTAKEGETFAGWIEGVYTLPCATGTAWATPCLPIYWDDANKRVTTTANGNTKIGMTGAADRIDEAAGDPAVRVLMITATGDVFCSGADLSQFKGESIPSSRRRMQHGGLRLVRGLWEMEKPAIAVVRGAAIGLGAAIALACDQIVADSTARYAFTYARVGLVPDTGAAYLLTRQMGLLRAKSLLFSSRFVHAAEALSLGLVSEVVADDELAARAEAIAHELGAGPTFGLGMMKRLLHRAADPSLADFMEYEALIAPQMRFTEDYVEGTSAFREKRAPQFKGY